MTMAVANSTRRTANASASCLGVLLALLTGCSPSSTNQPTQADAAGTAPAAATATAFCRISRWGPSKVHAGERFNQRDDGFSAFWFKGSCAPERVMLDFDEQLIETVRSRDGVTAAVNADGVLHSPGRYPLRMYDPASGTMLLIGELQVLEPRRPVALPEPPPRRWPAMEASITAPPLIAHAGGGYHGLPYLNSLDALDHNYALGHRVFEMDFCWTADDQLVAIHDWDNHWRELFPEASHEGAPTYAAFMAAQMIDGQSQVDLARLRDWLAAHPDAQVVTDIRGRNLYGLQRIKVELGEQFRQVIPQMYHAYRYPDIRALGYEQIIFTLYSTSLDTRSLLDFVRRTPLFAVTLDPSRSDAKRIIAALRDDGPPLYVHTFNKATDFRRFRDLGVHGLYTDFLYPVDNDGVKRQ